MTTRLVAGDHGPFSGSLLRLRPVELSTLLRLPAVARPWRTTNVAVTVNAMADEGVKPGGPTAAPHYRLLGADGQTYLSARPGTLGGHRGSRIYGRLDCPTALATIARGHYLGHRVFFADEPAALDVGFRPCGSCLRELYRDWKRDPEGFSAARRAQLGG